MEWEAVVADEVHRIKVISGNILLDIKMGNLFSNLVVLYINIHVLN